MSTPSKSAKITADRARRAKHAEHADRFGTNSQILITQVVGSVMPSEDGTQSMLMAAQMAAAEYIAENASTEHIELTFSINGNEFTQSYYPAEKLAEHRSPQSAEEYGATAVDESDWK